MKNIFITKLNTRDSLENPEVITINEFLDDIQNENDIVRVMRNISLNRDRLSLDKIKQKIKNDNSLHLRSKRAMEEAESFDDIIDELKMNLPYYCLSGYNDKQIDKFIHSGLYVLDYKEIEKGILIQRIKDDKNVICLFPSCSGASIKVIIKGEIEGRELDMSDVAQYHNETFNDIYRFYYSTYDFKPNRAYGDFSLGVLQSYSEDLDVNYNAEEFIMNTFAM